MPSYPVGRDGWDAQGLTGVYVQPPSVRRGPASGQTIPFQPTTPGPGYGGDAGAGSSGRINPVQRQIESTWGAR